MAKKAKNPSPKDIKQNKSFRLYKHPKFGTVFGEAVKLPPTRVAWPYLCEPKEGGTNDAGQVFNDRYEVIAIYPKKDKEFKKTCEYISRMTEAMIELFNKGKRTKVEGFEIGSDGDEADHERYPYYKGSTILTLRNANQPLIVGVKKDKEGKPKKIEPEAISGGCICAFVVTPLFTANGGLSFKMNIVQLIEDDGTRFGGSINPAVYADLLEFEETEEDEDEAASAPECDDEDEDEDDEVEEEEEEEAEDDEEEDEEDLEEEDEEDEEEEDTEDDDEDEEDEDEDEEEEEEVEEEKPRKRGRPAKRKKAVDVL